MNTLNSKFKPRSIDQIKSKFDNLKTQARKYGAEKNKNLKQTGGGPATNIKENIVLDIVLSIINKKTVIGLENIFDSDTVMESQEISAIEQQLIPVLDTETVLEQSYVVSSDGTLHPEKLTDSIPELKNQCVTDNMPTENNNWSTYTPVKMQKNRNKKLTIKTSESEFVKTKIEYMKAKIHALQQEEEERNLRMKQNVEIHEHKCKLMKLDIQIKEEQLKKVLNEN